MKRLRDQEGQLQALMLEGKIDRTEAMNALATLHLDKALGIARRRSQNDDGLREELEDAAIGGLMRAAQLFDPARGILFWTYAEHVINDYLRRYFRGLRESPIGLELPDASYSMDSMEMSERDVREIAALMLAEVGISHPSAVDALLGHRTKREAAELMGMDYNAFRSRIRAAAKTKTALEFRRYVEMN